MNRWLFGLALLVALGMTAVSAHAQHPQAAKTAQQSPIEPKAIDILNASCEVLANAKAMSFNALSTYERAARNGQPLYYAVLNQVTMQRPDKLRVITPGDGTPGEFYYNGKTMMAYVPSADLVAVTEAPPTIDQMVDAAWEKAAIYFPFVDVILSKPCAVYQEDGLNSAFYVGQSKVVAGTTTDMVAITGDNIQAELWIGAQDRLPRLVRVVYPHEPAHALYQTEFSEWRLIDSVDPGTFSSDQAAKGKPMAFAPPGLRSPAAAQGAAARQSGRR
jgi:hypothetical protein